MTRASDQIYFQKGLVTVNKGDVKVSEQALTCALI